jgi:hypothetical protein
LLRSSLPIECFSRDSSHDFFRTGACYLLRLLLHTPTWPQVAFAEGSYILTPLSLG